MRTLYCACCGRPFHRTSPRGPAPLYCSADCRAQMQVRRRVWSAADRPVDRKADRRVRALPAPA